MTTSRLTARYVETVKAPASGRAEYFDGVTPGFALRVTASGHKSWIVMYRTGGRVRRLTLGTYPAVDLADARGWAKDALQAAAKGGDPAGDKKAERAAETFAELAEQYLEKHAKRKKRSWRKDELILEKDILPRFRAHRAKDITRRDVIAMLDCKIARNSDPLRGGFRVQF